MFRPLLVGIALALGVGEAWACLPTALTGARLIGLSDGAEIEDGVIVMCGASITAVGAKGDTEIAPGAAVIDVRGRTIIPGLISDHSHVGVTDGLSVKAENYNRANILRQLESYGRAGVTSVAALGLNGPEFYALRGGSKDGEVQGADADLFGADRGIGVADGAPPAKLLPVGDNQLYRPATAAEARGAVDEMAERGADLIKLWLDDFGGSLPVKMKPEIYHAVIKAAHDRGLRVAAHIHDLADAKAIVEAGADILAHGVRDAPVDDELVAMLKERGVWYVPTLALDEATFVYGENPAWLRERYCWANVPADVAARIADPDWRRSVAEDPRSARARAALAMNQRNLKTLHDAGVRIGFGTDSGATPLRLAGIAEHRELALIVEAGLTPRQALQMATANAAELLRREDRGVLRAGALADLVVVDGNPTADVGDLARLTMVWHRGRKIVDRNARCDR